MHGKAVVLISAILVAGCAMKNTPKGPVPYQQGYDDGCASGYEAAGHPYYDFKKDVYRFNSDQLYAQGWNDGYQGCLTRYSNL